MSTNRIVANSRRVKVAVSCLRLYSEWTNSQGEEAIIDFVTDLGHLCDHKEIDFLNALDLAKMHWRSERDDRQKGGQA